MRQHSYLEALECTSCGNRLDADAVHGMCPTCGLVLFARYDLAGVRATMPQPDFEGRPWDLWRYHELLPIRDPVYARSLGEGATPLLRLARSLTDATGM
jgi:threonine synthase